MTDLEHDERPDRATVAPAAAETLGFTAGLHRRALPDGFFPALGERFLRAYHETFLSSPHAVAFTAWHGGEPAGFLVGTTANVEHYRWVARHRARGLAVIGLVALVRRPALAVHFLRTRIRRYLRALLRLTRRKVGAEQREGTPRTEGGGVAVLSHIAVGEEARSNGIGGALVEAFLAAAEVAGAREAQLVAAADATATHAFYRRHGWERQEDRPDHDGRMVTRFVHHIR